MAGSKLTKLQQEINHYLGIPYFSNTRHLKKGNVYVGKGTWSEIKSISSDYNYLKKNGIGIDCSGLVCHLLNFYFHTRLDVRKTSADMLTSPLLSQPISNLNEIQTGDLIRQKDGRHVVFIIKKKGSFLLCVESSRQGRGVHYTRLPLATHPQIYRLTSPQ